MDIRVCSARDLVALCVSAEKHQFNRQADTEKVMVDLDPQGINLLEVLVPYHRASFGPSREPVWPDHHRCMVFAKVNDTTEPVKFMLDVAVSDYERFMTAEALQEELGRLVVTSGDSGKDE